MAFLRLCEYMVKLTKTSDNMKRDYYSDIATKVFIASVLTMAIIGLALALFSCRTKKETCIEQIADVSNTMTARTDSLFVWKERTDSVVVRDSVFTLVKGDTVLIREYHYREREKIVDNALYKASADTVWRVRTVTVYKTKTKTVTVEVEKRLAWWQTALMWIGGIAVAVGIALAVRKLKRL